MEVHKHPHHVMHKKKWGEYILEFLMIFFAVFLGFIAENTRENITERHREKEYMKQMVFDLKNDTAMLTRVSAFANQILQATDSTMIILKNEVLTDSMLRLLYKFNLIVFRIPAVHFEDRTATQLKSSGGLQLIRNQTVLDSLSKYWERQKVSLTVMDNMEDKKNKMHELEYRIFLDTKYYSESTIPFKADVIGNPVLSSDASALLPEYSNRLLSQKQITMNYINVVSGLQKMAGDLITVIQKEYHLKS